MKLARFTESGRTRLGVVVDGGIVDLGRAAPELPTNMLAFLEAGEGAWDKARAAGQHSPDYPLDEVHLEAPVPKPGKVLAIGLNYGDHIKESGVGGAMKPPHFLKGRSGASITA